MLSIEVVASCSELAKLLSMNTSTLVRSEMLSSGLSRKRRTEAPSMRSSVPGSCSNSVQQMNPSEPVSSASLPLTTGRSPLPSRLLMTSSRRLMTRPTMVTNPSLLPASEMLIGSLVASDTAGPPSRSTTTRLDWLMFSERLPCHSFTDVPSSLTTEPGARFSAWLPQSLKSQRMRSPESPHGLSSIQPKAICRSSPRTIWMRGV